VSRNKQCRNDERNEDGWKLRSTEAVVLTVKPVQVKGESSTSAAYGGRVSEKGGEERKGGEEERRRKERKRQLERHQVRQGKVLGKEGGKEGQARYLVKKAR
jgi:hypothetical protein